MRAIPDLPEWIREWEMRARYWGVTARALAALIEMRPTYWTTTLARSSPPRNWAEIEKLLAKALKPTR